MILKYVGNEAVSTHICKNSALEGRKFALRVDEGM
jgi:hypothetical protein